MSKEHSRDSFFGGMFDFNCDGVTDIGEQFLVYKIFEEVMKEQDEEDADDLDDISYSDYNLIRATPSYQPTVASKAPATPVIPPPPEHVTQSEYKSQRHSFAIECIVSVIVAAVLCVLSGIGMWAAITSYDPNNSASGFVVTLFVVTGLVLMGIIVKAAAESISESYRRLQLTEDVYMNDALKDELAQWGRKKKRGVVLLCSILGAAVAVLIIIGAVNSAQVDTAYTKAKALISEQQYAQAVESLEQIEDKNYKDTAALIKLCNAYDQYNSGRIVDAYYTLKGVSFQYQPETQNAEIAAFKATLHQEYDDHIALVAERNRQEYEDRITNGVPFVGMPESRISDTSLGRPSSIVRHNSEMINGQRHFANLYDFYENGKRIFTARCIDGSVTQVWDERDKVQSTYTPKTGSGSSFNNDSEVDGFTDPDVFYYWHRDNFIDYEDAEDYYYSHGGK